MDPGDRKKTRRKNRRFIKKQGIGRRTWWSRIGRSVLSLAMLASLTLLGFTVYRYIQRSTPLNVGEIKILGCMQATESELLDLARVDFQTNLAHLDLWEISRRLAKHPWVEKANVKRDWSRKAVIIEVQERVPQALILLEGLYLLDRQGEVFKKAELKDRLDLPVFTGLTRQEITRRDARTWELLREGLELLEMLGQRKFFTSREVSEIHLSKQNGLTIFTLKGGIPIRLGSGKLADKLDRLEKVLPDIQKKSKDVEYMDLNYPRKVVVKIKEPEKEKSGRS